VILERVRIESFAGLADLESGSGGAERGARPHEAGKSTLFQAIRHTLLTPAA